MKRRLRLHTNKTASRAVSLAAVVALLAVGCKEQSKVEKSRTSAREAGDAIKDATDKTGKAIGDAAEKAWEGIKQGANEVGQVATNVAAQVKAGTEKAQDKLKQAVK